MTVEDKKRAVFKQHPNEKQFHFTSDATAFYNASDAKVYANTLEDNSVELVKRSDVLKPVQVVESTDNVDSKKLKVESTDKAKGDKVKKAESTDKVESEKSEVESNQEADTKRPDVEVHTDIDGVDKDALFAKLEALGGKAPKNTGVEKLQAKIAELEGEK